MSKRKKKWMRVSFEKYVRRSGEHNILEKRFTKIKSNKLFGRRSVFRNYFRKSQNAFVHYNIKMFMIQLKCIMWDSDCIWNNHKTIQIDSDVFDRNFN
jgi:hypothetical protein